MIVKLCDVSLYGTKITKDMVSKALDSTKVKELLKSESWYIDASFDMSTINPEKAAFVLKKTFFGKSKKEENILYGEIESLDTPIANKVIIEMKNGKAKFVMKCFVKDGVLDLIGFGYVYKGHLQ